jgi:hypothetical protein
MIASPLGSMPSWAGVAVRQPCVGQALAGCWAGWDTGVPLRPVQPTASRQTSIGTTSVARRVGVRLTWMLMSCSCGEHSAGRNGRGVGTPPGVPTADRMVGVLR